MKLKETLRQFFQVKHFKHLILALSIIAAGVLIFLAGIFVGLEKARFSYGWGEHYYENFVGRREPPPVPFLPDPDRDFFNAHGALGEIIRIDGNNIILKNADDTEVTVTTNSKTAIRSRRQILKTSDLKTGDRVIIIGSPNDKGQIQASFIRMPIGKFPF